VVVEFVTPFRTTTFELLNDQTHLMSVLQRGAEQAREVAARTLADVYDRVGFVAPTTR
jgi:tryptophanyl-tRNA synthetase